MAVSSTTGGLKTGVCLSTDRPDNPFNGQVIYETDTNRTLVWDNSAWVVIANASSTGFPTSLDTNTVDSIAALQAKVGADSSAVTSSHDYKIAQLEARGQLAVASSTADFTIDSTGVDIINTSVTLTTSRVLQIFAFAGATDNASTALIVNFRLESASFGTGTLYQIYGGDDMSTSAPDHRGSLMIVYTATFAAGTHNFYLNGVTNTGTCRVNNSSSRPTFLIVNDMGEP